MNRSRYLVTMVLLAGAAAMAGATEIFTTPPSAWPCGMDPRSLSIGNVDSDEALDIVVVNTAAETYSILLNDGAGNFGAPITLYAYDEEPRDVLLGDFDGDEDPDMVIPCTGDLDGGWTQIFLNSGFGFLHHQAIHGGEGPWHCVVDEFDEIRGLDVVLTYPWSGNLGTLHNDGSGDFSATISELTPHPIQLDKADLDGDGDVDIVFTQSEAPEAYGMCYAYNNGLGHFTEAGKYFVPGPTGGIAAGDFNGDTIPDVALGLNAGSGADNLRVYIARGDGGFHPGVSYGELPSALGLAAADFDGDEDLDLAVCSLYENTLAILHNDGAGGFASRETHSTAAGPYRIRAADINEDGMLDLALACLGAGVVQVFLNSYATAVDGAAGAPAGILGIQPNPFNPSGTLRYRIAREGEVKVAVYDTRGRLVRGLRSEWQAAGEHSITWDGRDDGDRAVPSGIYLIELIGPSVREACKAALLK